MYLGNEIGQNISLDQRLHSSTPSYTLRLTCLNLLAFNYTLILKSAEEQTVLMYCNLIMVVSYGHHLNAC